jgi:hypothetical protein
MNNFVQQKFFLQFSIIPLENNSKKKIIRSKAMNIFKFLSIVKLRSKKFMLSSDHLSSKDSTYKLYKEML